jgi:PKHD-type hydroxylase
MIMTLPNLLPGEVCADLVRRLEKQELQDGRLTAGPMGQGLKLNLQLVDTPEALAMSRQINECLTRDRHLLEHLAIRTALPFMFNCHRDGMQYKTHTDNPIMNYRKAELRCDLSATVFLSPPEDYDGGDLVIGVDENPTAIKLPAGGIVIYPSNTLHLVRPVTCGVRWAAVTWMQSRIRSRERREVYRHLMTAIRLLSPMSGQPANDRSRQAMDHLLRVRDDLLRMWNE